MKNLTWKLYELSEVVDLNVPIAGEKNIAEKIPEKKREPERMEYSDADVEDCQEDSELNLCQGERFLYIYQPR